MTNVARELPFNKSWQFVANFQFMFESNRLSQFIPTF